MEEFTSIVYAQPEYISTLETSTAISDHVKVDFELRGCPIDRRQLLDVVTAFLHGRRPGVRGHSVCIECKRVWVPKTSSRSCDHAIFVDHASDASLSSDVVLLEIDRFGLRFQWGSAVQ